MAITYTQASEATLQSLVDTLIAKIEEAKDKELQVSLINAFSGRHSSKIYLRNFRDILDNIPPVILFVNYNKVKNELNKYKNISNYKVGERTLQYVKKEELQETFRNVDGVIQGIIGALKEGINSFINESKPETINYNSLLKVISTQNSIGFQLLNVKKIYKLSGNIGPNITHAFVFPYYKMASDTIQKHITKSVLEYLTTVGKGNLLDSRLTGLLDLGHSFGVYKENSTEEEYYGNFPKLTNVILNVAQEAIITQESINQQSVSSSAQDIAEVFRKETLQISVNVSRQFSENFLKIFVSAGGQVLNFENRLINGYRGLTLEKDFPGGANKDLVKSFTDLLKGIINNTNLDQQIKQLLQEFATQVPKGTRSPSLYQYIENTVVSILKTGKSLAPLKEANPFNKNSASKIKAVTVKKAKLQSRKLPTTGRKASSIKPSRTSELNLNRLLSSINQQITQQIRQNMGTGFNKDVLNYRTGRFAESVKVERLSESRAGMITAFYSYMKNPYATFSQGGRQENPRSRDPKLLIAKSIREIASTLVTNRLRAVNL